MSASVMVFWPHVVVHLRGTNGDQHAGVLAALSQLNHLQTDSGFSYRGSNGCGEASVTGGGGGRAQAAKPEEIIWGDLFVCRA